MTLHRLEVIHGRSSEAPALVRHAVRFGRRLRQRGIHGVFPALVDDDLSTCMVAVGRRVVRIFADGSFTTSLRDRDRNFERGAFVAQINRMHAIFLWMARDARVLGLKSRARTDLFFATQERRHHERTNQI